MDKPWLRAAALAACVLLTIANPAAAGTIVFENATVLPIASAPIDNGVVVVEDGKIAAVGRARCGRSRSARPRSSAWRTAWPRSRRASEVVSDTCR